MNQDLGLKVLGQVMAWSDDRARKEFQWLRLMARLKYDGYRDFRAGMRFIESLATWLQQFEPEEREVAYAFVRQALVYIGPGEMQRVVEQFYPRTVHDRLVRTVAVDHGLPAYRVLADRKAHAAVERLCRQTLFMGLSDGARIDIVRYANAGLLKNEQLVVATQVDKDKWQDLLGNLRQDLDDVQARFRLVYLIDDFMGTGTSLLRYNAEKQKWVGKLPRFKESVDSAMTSLHGDQILSDGWELCIHHYVGTFAAAQAIVRRHEEARADLTMPGWAKDVHFTFGTVLPEELPIDAVPGRFNDLLKMTQTYYDPILRTRHTDVGGVTHLGLGYGGCALPLVLDHNTPNNSVALLWAETEGNPRDGVEARAMRPLFRRRQRHA
jgi:hypothetical protein